MAFTLPNLPYAPDALEPSIDKMTMEIHHGRHHKAYVDNLNKALEGHPEFQSLSIVQLMRDIKKVPEGIRQAVINNGGGHANHSLFWEIMAKARVANRAARWPTRSPKSSRISLASKLPSKMLGPNGLAAAGLGWFLPTANCTF